MSRVLFCALLASCALFAGEYSKQDRADLLRLLDNSRAGLASSVESVTQEQSSFKPDSNVWSILQILEHLALTEDFLRGILEKALETTKPAPDSEKLPDPSELDAAVRRGITDRSQKMQAPDQARPEGKYRNRDEGFFDFAKRREKTMDFVRTTKLDLRRYRINSPMGTLDAHQWIILIASHTERHMKQIEEVMKHELYPKPE